MAPDSLDDVSRPASGIPHRRQRARNQTAPVAPGAEPPVGRRTSGRPSKPYRRRRHRSGDAAVTRSELEHAIRAACDVSGDDELYVIGSQAILGQYPDAPDALRQSAEADVAPVHAIESRCDRCSARGVVIVPSGVRILRSWSVDNTRHKTGWCLEAHDLAASKLVAFREKDRDFVRVLIVETLITPATLLRRCRALPHHPQVTEHLRNAIDGWIRGVVRDIGRRQ